MMQKRTIYSLLLISFILVFALSLSAQEVIIPDAISMTRCTASSFDVTVNSPDALGAVEIVFEITGSGGAFFNAIDFLVAHELPGIIACFNKFQFFTKVSYFVRKLLVHDFYFRFIAYSVL